MQRILLELRELATRLPTSDNNRLLALAVGLGLSTGAAIWLFRQAIDVVHTFFVTFLQETVLTPRIGSMAVVICLALVGAIVGSIMDGYIGQERHHGVAGIVEAVALVGGRLRYSRIPFKAVASALSLGAGASVGPEDPSVQIGANIGSWFGQRLRLAEEQMRLLVAAGAASAIAAAFKAPIAGVFFALEVVLNGAFETRSFGIVVLAAVVASAFTQAIEPGSEMGPFHYSLGSLLEIPLLALLGVIIGPLAVLFIRAVYWQHDWWHHHVHFPRPLRTALAGALVGAVGIFFPQILGPGRETMNAILSGEVHFGLTFLLLLGLFKLLMTSVSMAGGFVGGVFAPTLFMCIVWGDLYGRLLQFLGLSALSDSQAYAIAGMAAMMGGVVRSPITAIMLVFELTNDYRLILPIMLATVVSIYIAEHLEPSGIYRLGLLRQGVHLVSGRETDLMQGVTVGEVMMSPPPIITATASLLELRDALRKYTKNSLCVVDKDGLLCGVVTLSDLRRAYDADVAQPLTVGDICSRDVVTIYPEETLWTAIRMMGQMDIGRLPFIKRGTREVIGLIGRYGMMQAYHLAVARKMQDQQTAERIRLDTLTESHVFEFHIVAGSLVAGKQIRDVPWPSESVVASIRRQGRLLIPHGDTQLNSGDALVVVAAPSAEPVLKRLTQLPLPE